MSDELRDMLRGRADAIDVPSGDVSTVVSGGRALKARRYAFAAVASVVVIAVVGWNMTGDGVLRGFTNNEVANPGATEPDPQETSVAVECGFMPFRFGYLPDGWDYRYHGGSGGQRGMALADQIPKALGHYRPLGDDAPVPGYIDVYERDAYYQLGGGGEPIEVLGGEGRIGAVEDGFTVEFTHDGCDYSVMAFGPPEGELRRVARGLQPRDTCAGRDIRTPDPLPDGRRFGYIQSTDGIGIEFDEAEFLSGEEANERAREDGVIGPNETVPNDYYIDDNNASVRAFAVSGNVDILLDTSSHDGTVGLSRWDFNDFVCMQGSLESIDAGHFYNGFWITVEDGVVTKIEEQWVP